MDHCYYYDWDNRMEYHFYADFYVVNNRTVAYYDDYHLPGAPTASVLDNDDLHDLIDRAVDHYIDHGPGEHHYDGA